MMVQLLAYEALGCWVVSVAISDQLPGEPEKLVGYRTATIPAADRGEAYAEVLGRLGECVLDMAYR